jgi:hypothetical protein
MTRSHANDTQPAARAMQLELLRAAPVWRKVEMWGQLNLAARLLARSGLRARYPHASEGELQRRLADLLLGAELAARVYGPLPEAKRDS